MHNRQIIVLFILLFLSLQVVAGQKIKILALFNDKVMLSIDGKQKLLKKNQSFKDVKLISSDSDIAILEVDGEKKSYKLGVGIATTFKEIDPGKELILWKNNRNMFYAKGSINKKAINFLIDTGASSVALSSIKAKQIGLKYKQGIPLKTYTASGISNGYGIVLDKVKIGHIVVYNVKAVVLKGSFPRDVLLGQSFLKHLHMTRDGNKMKLRKKF